MCSANIRYWFRMLKIRTDPGIVADAKKGVEVGHDQFDRSSRFSTAADAAISPWIGDLWTISDGPTAVVRMNSYCFRTAISVQVCVLSIRAMDSRQKP